MKEASDCKLGSMDVSRIIQILSQAP